jgi:hypothetical protein
LTTSKLPNLHPRCAGLPTLSFPLFGARQLITNARREFLEHLLEVNSTRVQSDVLERIQESRARLEVEIRKLLHEMSRITEQALIRARKTKDEGAPAVQAALIGSTGSKANFPRWLTT